MYDKGHGVPHDDAEAVTWIRKAAEQGFALAQNTLAAWYKVGKGVAQDHAEAAKWFRRAAEQGNAQNNLGAIYAAGQGVPRDMIGAYTWFSLAATAGNQSAAKNLDIAARHMTADEIAEAKRGVTEAKDRKLAASMTGWCIGQSRQQKGPLAVCQRPAGLKIPCDKKCRRSPGLV
jgi:TPR repeat protein